MLGKPVTVLKGVGPKRKKILATLGVHLIEDLLYYIPRSYRDRSKIVSIAHVKPEGEVTVQGIVKGIKKQRSRRGRSLVKIAFKDESGIAYATWFNQPYLYQQLKQGEEVLISGRLNVDLWEKQKRREFVHPVLEKTSDAEGLEAGRIVPQYSMTEGLNQKQFRRWVKEALDKFTRGLVEFLPQITLEKNKLCSRQEALWNIHLPQDQAAIDIAYRRLVFEEFFLLQLKLLKNQQYWQRKKGISHMRKGDIISRYLKRLPFKLTGCQQRAWYEINEDMEAPNPMNRLLQGDVGSGKTVLAVLSLLKSCENGCQGALMAPTEILAEQHYNRLAGIFSFLDLSCTLLTGRQSPREKQNIYRHIEEGTVSIVIGTHALIQESVTFQRLGMVVIDEQHRFGVEQREKLIKKGVVPDVLVMTATPIPRSLAVTLYGDLDVSVLKEKPPGRKPVVTRIRTTGSRQKIYSFVDEQVEGGKQVYVVCPLVNESEKLAVEAAENMFKKLSADIFPHRQIGLIHGQLTAAEKYKVMERFQKGEIQILVATSVIEVGVDVPQATVMLIEDAHRFGIAQLHQLRGRVGRGSQQSYCVLLSDATESIARQRLKALEKTNDGFKLAEEDLRLRGPGELFGLKQHGLMGLRVGDLYQDREILFMARQSAREFLQLAVAGSDILENEMGKRFPGHVAR